jgi:hypothetical protein
VPGVQSTMTTIALSSIEEIQAAGSMTALARKIAI